MVTIANFPLLFPAQLSLPESVRIFSFLGDWFESSRIPQKILERFHLRKTAGKV